MQITPTQPLSMWAFAAARCVSLRGICRRRVFCQLLRPDLDKVLAMQPPVRGSLLDLFYAVHHLEKKARKLFPPALGAHRSRDPVLMLVLGEPEGSVDQPESNSSSADSSEA